ncbi:MAG: GcrA family cell cycle regulator [Alphaproteobacteria bacterium]|jgi:GcrA cell cycle regulator|nr:hypothetical protein [Alphaproteobacteria bacterium]
MAPVGWTPAILNKMKSLLGKGLSTAEIGKKIGMSKNAVVGKLNRLGWSNKPASDIKKKTPVKKTTTAKVKPVKKDKIKKEPVQITKKAKATIKASTRGISKKNLIAHQHMIQHAVELAMLRSDQCRWPIGNPDTEKFHFCGAKVFPGKPYCYEHCRAAYQMPPPKKS